MKGNLDRRMVGKCSACGGIVSVPTVYMSVNRPTPSCEDCGRQMDVTSNLPTVKTVDPALPNKSHREY